MNTDKILYYTDGHHITVTDAGFKVNNHLYQLTGITRHGLSVVSPPRTPSLLLMIIGSLFFLCGALDFIPASLKADMHILGFTLQANMVTKIGRAHV